MTTREVFFFYPRFFAIFVTLVGLLGTSMLLPGPLSDPLQPRINKQASTKTQNNKLLANKIFAIPTQFQGKVIRKVDLGNQQKVVALTFDDGPWPKTTLQVLDILKQNNIKATFFWVGRNLKNFPDIGKQVVADGHAIGNHTWHHWYFRMNPAKAAAEIENTAALIYQITGVKTSLFRPPGGYMNNGVAAYARSQKYGIMMWSVDPGENYPKRSSAMLVNNVVTTAQPGGIILLHDIHPRTVEALPEIIAGLKQRGFQFVTVPQLLAMQPKTQKPKVEAAKKVVN